MALPTAGKTGAAQAADDDDPVEAAFRHAPLCEMPETEEERAMMTAALAEPNAWISEDEHRASLAKRILRER